LRRAVEEEWAVRVVGERELRAGNGRVSGLAIEKDDFGGTGSIENCWDDRIGDLRGGMAVRTSANFPELGSFLKSRGTFMMRDQGPFNSPAVSQMLLTRR
jgi:hypothetical protein